MKQKLFIFFLALVASVGTMFASDTQVDGIWYVFDDSNNTASVTYRGSYFDSYSNEYSGSVVIPSSVTYYGKQYAVTSIGSYAFYECTGLTSIKIPNSVTSIKDDAFYKCAGLVSIEIPNSVTSIGNYAFRYCSGLTSVIIGNSVTSIGRMAFSGCTGLTSIEIPNSVTSIEEYAFQNCSGLISVIAHAKLFNDGCFGFDNYEIPSHIKHITINNGELTSEGLDRIRVSYRDLETIDLSGVTNTELPDMALNGCYKLQTITLPQNLGKIGYMAVADCKNLQSINIPASVTEISQSAFENCRSLKAITFGGQATNLLGVRNSLASTSQLQSIGNWAFYNCHELQNLEIPEGVTFIGDGAFYGCVYLEDLTLPSSVQTIGDNTFALCAKLQKIVVNAPVPPSIQAKTFYDVKRQIPVYVPDESVDAYKNDAQWSEFDIQGVSKQPTAIDQVESSSLQTGNKGRLILRNGQVLILRGNHTYTLTGTEVQ